jgi:anti-sigma-K factor RskA
MSDQKHITELIPAYALDCLDEPETLLVASHLAGCPDCQRQLQAYQAVAAQLALIVPEVEPDVQLKQRLLARVTQPAPQRRPTPLLGNLTGDILWRPAVAFVILLLLLSNLFLWRQLNLNRQPPGSFYSITLQPTEQSPQARGLIVLNESGLSGTLIVDGLPELDAGQQYQLWLIRNGQRTDGGVFSIYPNGYFAMLIHAPEPLAHYDAFGITIEPAGGSPGPTGARVLGGGRS